jgi:hypothetical protein
MGERRVRTWHLAPSLTHLRLSQIGFLLLALFRTPLASPVSTLVPVDPEDGVLEELLRSFLRAPKAKRISGTPR